MAFQSPDSSYSKEYPIDGKDVNLIEINRQENEGIFALAEQAGIRQFAAEIQQDILCHHLPLPRAPFLLQKVHCS
jgi:hypothetical protein